MVSSAGDDVRRRIEVLEEVRLSNGVTMDGDVDLAADQADAVQSRRKKKSKRD
jgi:hypothetical protein